MKLPELLAPHHLAGSQMTGSSFLQHTRLISLSRLLWDMQGGHFLIFSALVTAVVLIMMPHFYIFTHKKQMLLMMERDRCYPKSFCKGNNTSKNSHLLPSDETTILFQPSVHITEGWRWGKFLNETIIGFCPLRLNHSVLDISSTCISAKSDVKAVRWLMKTPESNGKCQTPFVQNDLGMRYRHLLPWAIILELV